MGDPAPDVVMGTHLNQMRAVNEAESLQDFRREREGHLMIRDDRPMMIMSFGTKYSGPHGSKYKVEGKYHIPVGYKAIIKWDEDEIVFMTREAEFGPEFQIIYLPKSAVAEDFTLFEWNPNISEIWDQLLTVLETQEKDMNMFQSGPWHTFGIQEDTVQIAVNAEVEKGQAQVEGVLYCSSGTQPTLEEYEEYLGFKFETDEPYSWVVHEFMKEALPHGWDQYIHNGTIYWQDPNATESTWKHPHFDKYKSMLAACRIQKVLPHWKSIMSFQIEFLFSRLYTWEAEASGKYPKEETIENVMEMARIFKVAIDNEPYLVHVLKRALRHYGQLVKEKRAVTDIEDFRNLMQRYRDIVGNFEAAKQSQEQQTRALLQCVECSASGSTREAVLYCDNCRDLFCQQCFDRLHDKGRRKNHRRTWVELGVCAECEDALAVYHCVQCQDAYCAECFQEWHQRGGRRNHIPIVLRSFSTQTHKVPATSVFDFGNISAAAVTLGSGAAQNLNKALSPWIAFVDESDIRIYYNVRTTERRRDLPLDLLNEPLEDGIGGGMGVGWAGSWGANMFQT